MRPFLTALAICLGVLAWAQPGPERPRPIQSIESIVQRSETIFVGTIIDKPLKEGYGNTLVSLRVAEKIKGAVEEPYEVSIRGSLGLVRQMIAKKSRILVAFGEESPQHIFLVDNLEQAVPKSDFSLITKGDDLVAYVKARVRLNPEIYAREDFVLPIPQGEAGDKWARQIGGEGANRSTFPGLVVPVDAQLEQWAQKNIASDDADWALTSVRALAFFKSEKNIALLKIALQSPITRVMKPANEAESRGSGAELGFVGVDYVVRWQAYHVLTKWNVPFERPELSKAVEAYDSVTNLSWSRRVDQDFLNAIAKMSNLQFLNISSASMGREELAGIARVKSLVQLQLTSVEGLKDSDFAAFAAHPNLKRLYLTNVPLTDAVVDELMAIKSLETVEFRSTWVTEDGVKRLIAARPNLLVEGVETKELAAKMVVAGKTDELATLINRHPDLIKAEPGRDTLLHVAASAGQPDIVRMLLERGMDVNALGSSGRTPFFEVMYSRTPKARVIWLLVEHGADLNKGDYEGNTPLHHAMTFPDPWYVNFLVKNGADLFAKNKNQAYPLNGGNRVPQPIQDWVIKLMEAKRNPTPMLPLTVAGTPNTAYSLAAGSTYSLSTTPTGTLWGDLRWNESPRGRAYLGPFGQQKVALKLDKLPEHHFVTVELELWILGSWDGNGDGEGPDLMDVSVTGHGSLLHSTFYNNADDGREGLRLQSYPDPYLKGYYKGYNAAAEAHTLGFDIKNNRDAVYKMSFTFAHTGDLELVLEGLTVPQERVVKLLQDEHWGISRLVVKTD